MKTIRTTDIARAIATRYDIELREATAFVNAMVDVMNDALHYEKLVKVKGLGTFKVTTVSSRESIDVTTGERINIDARDKITFTPDPALRDRVNAPFAQFETVVVNDGVDFSEIDSRLLEPEERDTEDTTSRYEVRGARYENTPANGETQSEDTSRTSHLAPRTSEESASHLENSATLRETTQEEELEERENSRRDAEKVEKVEEAEGVEGVEGVEDAEVSEAALTALRQQLSDLQEEHDGMTRRYHRSRCVLYGAIVGLVLLLAVNLGLLAYLLMPLGGRETSASSATLREATQEEEREDTTSRYEVRGTRYENTPANGETQAEDTSRTSHLAPRTSEESTSHLAPRTSEESIAQADDASSYDADPRIRLGAYRIVGIDRTVTVQRGQTFKMISRAHLGEGMECYMEAVNPGVTTVSEGDILNIPKLQLKKRMKK